MQRYPWLPGGSPISKAVWPYCGLCAGMSSNLTQRRSRWEPEADSYGANSEGSRLMLLGRSCFPQIPHLPRNFWNCQESRHRNWMGNQFGLSHNLTSKFKIGMYSILNTWMKRFSDNSISGILLDVPPPTRHAVHPSSGFSSQYVLKRSLWVVLQDYTGLYSWKGACESSCIVERGLARLILGWWLCRSVQQRPKLSNNATYNGLCVYLSY